MTSAAASASVPETTRVPKTRPMVLVLSLASAGLLFPLPLEPSAAEGSAVREAAGPTRTAADAGE